MYAQHFVDFVKVFEEMKDVFFDAFIEIYKLFEAAKECVEIDCFFDLRSAKVAVNLNKRFFYRSPRINLSLL